MIRRVVERRIMQYSVYRVTNGRALCYKCDCNGPKRVYRPGTRSGGCDKGGHAIKRMFLHDGVENSLINIYTCSNSSATSVS